MEINGKLIQILVVWDQAMLLQMCIRDRIIGADVNITQDDKRKCRESGNTPGVDGWYGSGQLYAGIQGAFGIYVDIWFIEGKFEFLRGSIALLMNGGLPNPSWFYAKGAFKYKVIGLSLIHIFICRSQFSRSIYRYRYLLLEVGLVQ